MWKLSFDDKAQAVAMYESGQSLAEIAKQMNVTASAILNLLRRRQVAIRSGYKKRLHCLTENMFKNLDSSEKAYWLGFLAADGWVDEQRHSLYLELSQKDSDHLCKFREFMGSSAPIKTTKKKCKRIILNSKTMIRQLVKLGITGKKSFTLTTPKMPSELLSGFYRGILDGDGWIVRHRIVAASTSSGFHRVRIRYLKKSKLGFQHPSAKTVAI